MISELAGAETLGSERAPLAWKECVLENGEGYGWAGSRQPRQEGRVGEGPGINRLLLYKTCSLKNEFNVNALGDKTFQKVITVK